MTWVSSRAPAWRRLAAGGARQLGASARDRVEQGDVARERRPGPAGGRGPIAPTTGGASRRSSSERRRRPEPSAATTHVALSSSSRACHSKYRRVPSPDQRRPVGG